MTTPLEQAALSALWGARAQRVDGPEEGLFCLRLFQAGTRHNLLLSLRPGRVGVGLAAERPKGQPASALVQRLRGLIENARLAEAHWIGDETHPERARALRLRFARRDGAVALVAELNPHRPVLWMLDADGRVLGASDPRALAQRGIAKGAVYSAPATGEGIAIASDAALEAAGEELTSGQHDRAELERRKAVSAALRAAIKRVRRKVEAVRGDVARTALAPELRKHANLLLCALDRVPRGVREVELDDPEDDGRQARIALDPERSPTQNAQAMFDRARRLDRGRAIASERLASVLEELDVLERLEAQAEALPLDELEAHARARRIRLGSAPSVIAPKKRGPQTRTPFRIFEAQDGTRILVGKGAADNDTLTLTVAKPHDHWLHVRGAAGAHVIIQLTRGAMPRDTQVLDAAHLAAHFSDLRAEPVVEVSHTPRRYVRKPKGAAPGAVLLDREKVLNLRVEPERLARLLAAELS